MQAKAITGHDLSTLAALAAPGARCMRDGEWVGDGPQAFRDALEAEFRLSDELVARVVDLDGGPAVVEYADSDGKPHPVGLLRVEGGDQVTALRIDHDADLVRRLVASARPKDGWLPPADRP